MQKKCQNLYTDPILVFSGMIFARQSDFRFRSEKIPGQTEKICFG